MKELKEVIKTIKKRIKDLQLQLVTDKKEDAIMGGYEDCGNFYRDAVVETEAKIEELIRTKIMIERYNKSIRY